MQQSADAIGISWAPSFWDRLYKVATGKIVSTRGEKHVNICVFHCTYLQIQGLAWNRSPGICYHAHYFPSNKLLKEVVELFYGYMLDSTTVSWPLQPTRKQWKRLKHTWRQGRIGGWRRCWWWQKRWCMWGCATDEETRHYIWESKRMRLGDYITLTSFIYRHGLVLL